MPEAPQLTARSKDETEKGVSESDSNYVKLPPITSEKGALPGLLALAESG